VSKVKRTKSLQAHNMKQLDIEKVTVDDLDTVFSILLDAVQWLRQKGLKAWDPSSLKKTLLLSIEADEVYLAKLNQQPVGTITVQWLDPALWGERPNDAGYIHKLAVLRALENRLV